MVDIHTFPFPKKKMPFQAVQLRRCQELHGVRCQIATDGMLGATAEALCQVLRDAVLTPWEKVGPNRNTKNDRTEDLGNCVWMG